MCFYVHGKEAAWRLECQRGESHQCLISQTRLNLNQKGRKPHGTTFLNVTNISFHPHSVFHSLFLLSSLTFLHRELEREKEQREIGTGLQDPLNSADHQQLRADVDSKEMKSRGGGQAAVGSCSPTPLSPSLVSCCEPGAGARCRNSAGILWGAGASLSNTLPLGFFCLGNRSQKGSV